MNLLIFVLILVLLSGCMLDNANNIKDGLYQVEHCVTLDIMPLAVSGCVTQFSNFYNGDLDTDTK